jgi:hypothetical protein
MKSTGKLILLLVLTIFTSLMVYEKAYARIMSEDDFQFEPASCGSGFCFDDPIDGGGGGGGSGGSTNPTFPGVTKIVIKGEENKGSKCTQEFGKTAECNYYFVALANGLVDIKADIGIDASSFKLTVYDLSQEDKDFIKNLIENRNSKELEITHRSWDDGKIYFEFFGLTYITYKDCELKF